jgi:hypothetical protein
MLPETCKVSAVRLSLRENIPVLPPQIVNLNEDAGFQSVIVDVISSIIMIWMIKKLDITTNFASVFCFFMFNIELF